MKKLLAVLFLISMAKVCRADILDDIGDRSYEVKYQLAVAAQISTNVIVIDLSDTVNFPHKQSGEIEITNIKLNVDKTAASTETIKLGVVNQINVSSGSVTWFWSNGAKSNVSNTDTFVQNYGSDHWYRLRANEVVNSTGTTPYILSNDLTSASQTFQNDVALPCPTPLGQAFPGMGDLILQANNGAVAIDLSLEIHYFARRR